MKVCLVAIVKDEKDDIVGMLETMKPYIDAWVISDTGSTDGTQEIIENYMRGVPGKLIQDTWQDFGTNRTRNLRAAEEWLKSEASPRNTDDDWFFFWIDADDRFEAGSNFRWPTHKGTNGQADAFAMKVQTSGMAHVRVQLFAAFKDWEFHGPIHEYPFPATGGQPRIAPFNGPVYHCPDPKVPRSRERFENDAKILEKYLESHPNDPRTQFYLGQSYFDMGEYKKSSRWYRARAENAGWPEEAWYAQYRVLVCAILTKQPDDTIIHEGLKAFNMRPNRAEPLFCLGRHFRKQPRAYVFACTAAAIPKTTDSLFVETQIYQWAAVDEAATAASYCGLWEVAMAYSEQVLKVCPPSEYERIYANMAMFRRRMAGLQ